MEQRCASGDPEGTGGLERLLRETRAVREAVHALVVRMQRDRRQQDRQLAALFHSTRLTGWQRQRLRDRYVRVRRSRD